MPVRRADALLDGERAFGVALEQVLVVVGLDEQAVYPGNVVDYRVVDVAEVGENGERCLRRADGEPHRVGRVVRHGKGRNFECSHAEGAAGGKDAPRG